MPSSEPFPLYVDSSIRAAFVSCPQAAFRQYMQHWAPKQESPDLVAGGAFAAGVDAVIKEAFEKGNQDNDLCLGAGALAVIKAWGNYNPPEGHVKTLDRILGALDFYFESFGLRTDYITPLIQDGKVSSEFSFALPIPNTQHPETGEPILYAGRFDMLGVYQNSLFVRDEKTTKQLGPTWPGKWLLRGQITGYCWAARQYGYPVAGAIIRGISILKNNYGKAESIQYRTDYQIDLWLHQLTRDVQRMIACWKEGYWDYNFGDTCTMYSGCPFRHVCGTPYADRLLEEDFVKRKWDPLHTV